MLNADRIPTRMGYVVRCSNLEAQHINHQTYISENGRFIKLDKMTPETQEELRSFYYEENKSEELIKYGKIHFSMTGIDFESIAKGRMGNHLVKVNDKGVPIVRTTTKYNVPAHDFSAIHHAVVDRINDTIVGNNLVEIPAQHLLTHHSVILFSLATNTKFLHKIVLDAAPDSKQLESDNRWLGITFCTSKTYIQFEDHLPRFSTENYWK